MFFMCPRLPKHLFFKHLDIVSIFMIVVITNANLKKSMYRLTNIPWSNEGAVGCKSDNVCGVKLLRERSKSFQDIVLIYVRVTLRPPHHHRCITPLYSFLSCQPHSPHHRYSTDSHKRFSGQSGRTKSSLDDN